MARRAPRAAQGRALAATLAAAAALVAACGGGGPQPGAVVTVSVVLPGASPAETEQQLLAPLEVALATIEGVYGMRGRAVEGGAAVDVTFRRGVDSLAAREAVRTAIALVDLEMPAAAEPPLIVQRPVGWMLARVTDQPAPFERLSAELGRLPIARVEQCGVRQARLVADVVPAKMTAMGLTLADIALTFRSANVALPAGRIDASGRDVTVRVVGEAASYDQIADTVVGAAPVSTRPPTPSLDGAGGVKLRDVAVLTQRSEARCLVDGAAADKTPALVRVGLRDLKDRARVAAEMKKLGLGVLKDAATFATPGRPTRVSLVAAPVGPVVEAVLTGDDAAALADAGRKALAALRATPGVAAAWCQGCELDTTERLEIDRDGADARKLVPAKIAAAIRAALVGERVATYRDGDLEIDLIVTVEESETRWRDLPIRSDEGKVYPLGEVVRATKSAGPRDILHVDRRRAVAVLVRGAPKTPAKELQKLVAAALPGTRPRTVDPAQVDGEHW